MDDWRKKISIEDAYSVLREAIDTIYDLENCLGIGITEPVLNPNEVTSAVAVALDGFMNDRLANLSVFRP